MIRRLACALVLAACSKPSDKPPAPTEPVITTPRDATGTPADALARIDQIETNPDRPSRPREADDLPPGSYTVSSSGFLRITKGKRSIVEGLPPSPHDAGEFPEACWAAPDGSVYVVGKQYTGVPGPDDGVVYKRDPDGNWSTEFRLVGRTFGSITGLTDQDIVVGTMRGYVVFDGTHWRVHRVPYDVVYVWSDGKRIYGQDFSETVTFTIDRGEARLVTRIEHDWRDDKYECARGGVTYRAFNQTERD